MMKNDQILGKNGPRPYFRHFSVPDPVQKAKTFTVNKLKVGFALVTVFSLLFTSGAPTAFVKAASVDPVLMADNPKCSDIGPGFTEFKIDEDPATGQYTDGTLIVDVTANGDSTIDWESNIGVDYVIMKGGPDGNVYGYDPEEDSDQGLITPTNVHPSGDTSKDKPYGISHVSFCYDVEQTPETFEICHFDGETYDYLGGLTQAAFDEHDGEGHELDKEPTENNECGTVLNCDEQTLRSTALLDDNVNNIVIDPCDPPADDKVTVSAKKIVCPLESDLPDWSGGVNIESGTAATFLLDNPQCELEEWDFQWGFDGNGQEPGVHMTKGDWVGPAALAGNSTGLCPAEWCGNNTTTGTGYNEWKSFDTSTPAVIDMPEGTTNLWVREELKAGYHPFSAPVTATPLDADDVSAEIYCSDDVLNYDNYDLIQNVELGETYHCVAFNAPKGAIIKAHKIVCDNQGLLPNWGTTDSAISVGPNTATDFLASSEARTAGCHFENWDFQWGYGDRANEEGVDMLPGNVLNGADGTNSTGFCPPPWCGVNTFEGDGYNQWKDFTDVGDELGLTTVVVPVLEGVDTIWVREELKAEYVPFSAPVNGEAMNSEDESAEMYCQTDVFNYDNYDFITNPVAGQTYYCIAINAEIEDEENGPCTVDCDEEEDTPITRRGGGGGNNDDDDDETPLVPSVLGDSINMPATQPEVLGASTLPRTGTPTWVLVLIVLLAVPAIGYKTLAVSKS